MDETKNKMSRRVILGGGLAVGAGGVGAAAMAGLGRPFLTDGHKGQDSWWATPSVALENAAAEAWAVRVGTAFEIDGGDAGQASYTLTAVHPVASPGERPDDVARRRGFILHFEGDRRLEGDRIYSARHSAGSLDIYFSAAPTDTEEARLLAAFN